ncbi:MAG TPA: nuclear transport factor 2 family protein, partial [Methanotrichaceae archaeon]|nr:nuclear transport factor 2 family protein [Methanotrichaceae archaeon]
QSEYHDDAELVAFNFVLKGKDAIRQFFAGDLMKRSGKILAMTEEAYFESDDVILFTMSIKSENTGVVAARDALYLKDGKIFRHIALTIPPDKDKKICQGLKQGS